jgi:membrane fusion protein (multidrug efflux system)
MRAEFPNAGNRLLPGQFVRLRLEGKPLEGAVTVPAACLMQSAQGRFVYVLGEGNVATMRPVQIEVIVGPLAVVSVGLKSGDRVILDNLVKIRPGAPLVPRPPAAK